MTTGTRLSWLDDSLRTLLPTGDLPLPPDERALV
jgi:hypothetical protein